MRCLASGQRFGAGCGLSALATACLIASPWRSLAMIAAVGADEEDRGRNAYAEGRLDRVRVLPAADDTAAPSPGPGWAA